MSETTFVYHVHPDTGVYQGASEARADPLEFEQARQAAWQAIAGPAMAAADALAASEAPVDGEELEAMQEALQADLAAAEAARDAVAPTIWLLPAHATFLAPPEPAEGEQAVFDGEAWSLRPVPEAPAEGA